MVGCVTLCHNNPSVVLPGTNIYVPLHQILSFRLRDPLRDPAYLARGQEARHSSVVSKRQMDRGNSDCCFVQARKHNHRSVSRFRSGIALLLHTNVGPCSQITFGILCFVWGDLCCTCTYFWSPCWASDPCWSCRDFHWSRWVLGRWKGGGGAPRRLPLHHHHQVLDDQFRFLDLALWEFILSCCFSRQAVCCTVLKEFICFISAHSLATIPT